VFVLATYTHQTSQKVAKCRGVTLGKKVGGNTKAVAAISVGDWGDERRRREDRGAEGGRVLFFNF